MITSIEPTSEQQAILNSPQDLYKYSPYIQPLFDSGLLSAAAAGRMDDCGQKYTKYQDREHHVWINPHHCMNNLCLACEDRKSHQEFEKYSLLEGECPERFTYLDVRQEVYKKVLKLLNKLGIRIAKVGFRKGRLAGKIILLAPIESIPDKVLRKIQQLDYELVVRSYDKAAFFDILRRVLRPDIPTDLEHIQELKGIKRRLTLQGASKVLRSKLVVEEKPSLTNNSSFPPESHEPDPAAPKPQRVPHCPKCGAPAIKRTQVMTLGTSIWEERWTPMVYESPQEAQEFT